MPVTNTNIPVLDRKEWQTMTPAPASPGAGAMVIAPDSHLVGFPAMYVLSTTAVYLYNHEEDGWQTITSPALAGTTGAGTCGAFSPWSITYTATGGTTTTVTVAAATHNITATVVGQTVEFLSAGTATGQRRVITGINSNAGAGTITLTLDHPVATAILNTHTFRIASGRYFVLSAYTAVAAGVWKVWDQGTYAWQANLSTTNLPAAWGTSGGAACTARLAKVRANGTATGGTTTTLTDSAANWTTDQWAGRYVLTVSGTGAGQCLKIASNTATTLTFDSPGTAPDNTTVYQIRGGSALAVGVATEGSATTLVNSAKDWTANQWTNFQVRIISGTGAGDKRKITANTANTLTIASGTALDSTSVYEIEPDEDAIYVLGNAAATMYRYSISANTWTVLAPTTARGGNAAVGASADFISCTKDPLWSDENANFDGRYIYSLRGGATGTIDRFDIAGGTSGAGAWSVVNYPGSAETFSTGTSTAYTGKYLYIRVSITNTGPRFFRYDLIGNEFTAFNTDLYPESTAVYGAKTWIKSLDSTEAVQWLYYLGATSWVLRRIGIV